MAKKITKPCSNVCFGTLQKKAGIVPISRDNPDATVPKSTLIPSAPSTLIYF